MKDSQPKRPHRPLFRLELRWWVISVIFFVFLCALTWYSLPETTATGILQATLTGVPYPIETGTPTIPPFELIANRDQTTGIIIASLILVMIILSGAYFGSRRKSI